MRRIILLLALLIFAGDAIAQSIIRDENMPDFKSVALSGNMNVEMIKAEANSIEVELYDSEVKKFSWSMTGDGVLSVTLRPTVGRKARADVRVFYKSALQDISVNDAKLTVADTVESPIFVLSVSGGGNALLKVKADDVEVEAAANSVAVVSGVAKYLSVRATERSKVDTRELKAVSVDAEAVTGGEIYVFASERVVANARSASTIYYAGSPAIIKNRTSRTSIGSGVYGIETKLKD